MSIGGTFTVQNLTIACGYSTGLGGGIHNDGTLTVINSTFTGNNSVESAGGAIYSGGTLTVTDSRFSNNGADSGGGIASIGTLTATFYFRSQCNPLGRNPNGQQLFAIQPDGTGLQQLTDARGFVRNADRTVDVETIDYHVHAP